MASPHGVSPERGLRNLPQKSPIWTSTKKNEGGGNNTIGIYINAWPIDFNRKCVRMNNEGQIVSSNKSCGRHVIIQQDNILLCVLIQMCFDYCTLLYLPHLMGAPAEINQITAMKLDYFEISTTLISKVLEHLEFIAAKTCKQSESEKYEQKIS